MKPQMMIITVILILLLMFGCNKPETNTNAQATEQQSQKAPDSTQQVEQIANEMAKDAKAIDTSEKVIEFDEYENTLAYSACKACRNPVKGGTCCHNYVYNLRKRCLSSDTNHCECQQYYRLNPDDELEGGIVNCTEKFQTSVSKEYDKNLTFEEALHVNPESLTKKQVKYSVKKKQMRVKATSEEWDFDAVIREDCPIENGVISNNCECYIIKDMTDSIDDDGNFIVDKYFSKHNIGQRVDCHKPKNYTKRIKNDDADTIQQDVQTPTITGNELPEQPESNSSDSNLPDSSERVANATQSVYESIQALSPKFKKCWNDAMKLPANHGVKHFNYKDGRVDLEYDENGVIYWKDSPSIQRLKKPSMPVTSFTSCYKQALPKSFDIHLEDVVRDYPDNVQRFGRLRIIFNPYSDKIEIVDVFSNPIGTTHNLLEEFNQKHYPEEFVDWKSMTDEDKINFRLNEINLHYNLWLNRRSNKIE